MVERRRVGFDLVGSTQDTWLSQRQQEHRTQIETLTSGFNIPLLPISCNRPVTPQILYNLVL